MDSKRYYEKKLLTIGRIINSKTTWNCLRHIIVNVSVFRFFEWEIA